MTAYGTPRGEADIARRIARLEQRGLPRVMVWKPNTSASGNWEAMGDGWTIEEESPSVFADRLEARLTAPETAGAGLGHRAAGVAQAPAGEAAAGASPAGQAAAR